MKAISISLCMLALNATAADKSSPRPSTSTPAARLEKVAQPVPPAPLVYRPPKVGLPKVTTACGTRDVGDEHLELSVLAPDHIGWTSASAPILLWHRQGPNRWPLEATLVIPQKAEPILQIKLEEQGEWHQLDLSKHGVQLEVGVAYQWAVAAILDPKQRSRDLVAGGMIQRVNAPVDLTQRLGKAAGKERIREFAERGYWYDAIAGLAAELRKAPDDAELRQWSSDLCVQAGLAPMVIGEVSKPK